MKILITSGHLDRSGGVANYVRLLLKNFKDKKVSLEHFKHGLPSKFHKTPLVPFIWLFQFFKFFIIMNSDKIDGVHFNPSLNKGSLIRDFVFLNIAHLGNKPVLFFIRGWSWPLFQRIKENEFLKQIVIYHLKNADKILVLSNDFKEALVELGIVDEKISVTSTMVESDKYRPDKKKFRKPYKILLCSRMARDKGIFELLEVVPNVIKQYPQTKFVFMGDGPCLDELKKKANNMGIDENVVFTGYQTGKDKIEWYKKSHLFVFPTYHGEGFPNVALEAMAAGLPIITTMNAGLKRTIKQGENGYFLSSMPSDHDEIAEKIIGMLDNPNKMKEISERNLKDAEEKYDVEAVSEEIKDIYKDILK